MAAMARWAWVQDVTGIAKAAVDLLPTPEDLAEIAEALARTEVQGERLPEAVLRMTGLWPNTGEKRWPPRI